MFSWTSHPVPIQSYSLPVSSMRPTDWIAESRNGFASVRRFFHVALSASFWNSSTAWLSRIASTGRCVRITMLSNAT